MVRSYLEESRCVTDQLVLLSQESFTNAWVNFESGFCRGLNSTVVPIAIREFTFDKLKFPLAGFQGRYIADIEGILLAIGNATGRVPRASILSRTKRKS